MTKRSLGRANESIPQEMKSGELNTKVSRVMCFRLDCCKWYYITTTKEYISCSSTWFAAHPVLTSSRSLILQHAHLVSDESVRRWRGRITLRHGSMSAKRCRWWAEISLHVTLRTSTWRSRAKPWTARARIVRKGWREHSWGSSYPYPWSAKIHERALTLLGQCCAWKRPTAVNPTIRYGEGQPWRIGNYSTAQRTKTELGFAFKWALMSSGAS